MEADPALEALRTMRALEVERAEEALARSKRCVSAARTHLDARLEALSAAERAASDALRREAELDAQGRSASALLRGQTHVAGKKRDVATCMRSVEDARDALQKAEADCRAAMEALSHAYAEREIVLRRIESGRDAMKRVRDERNDEEQHELAEAARRRNAD